MKKYFFLMVLFSSLVEAKVLIMTYVYNRPDFIELHHRTFESFLKDDYEYVVFNDAPNQSMRSQIEQICKAYGIRCFRVPDHARHRQTPSYRHMDGIKFSFETIGYDHDDIVVMVDADMFLVRPFSIVNYLKNYDIFGVRQKKELGSKSVTYIAPLLVFLDMHRSPDKQKISFEADRVEGVPTDVGGHMHYYFKSNPQLRVQLIDPITITTLPTSPEKLRLLGYDKNTIDLILNARRFEYYLNGTFIHYYAGGSNWPGYSPAMLAEKNKFIYQFIDKQFSFYTK